MRSTLKGNNLLVEEQILSLKELTRTAKGGKNGRVASSESLPITFILL